jgi:hypothetical protein
MADKYVPGMEFQSWRSLPKITDMLDSGSTKGFAIGGLINYLSGGNTQLPTNPEQYKSYRQGIPNSVPPVPNATTPAITANPMMPATPNAPAVPPNINGQQPNVANPLALPGVPLLDTEPSIFDSINGIRR